MTTQGLPGITYGVRIEPTTPALPRAGVVYVAGLAGTTTYSSSDPITVRGTQASDFVGADKIAGMGGTNQLLQKWIQEFYSAQGVRSPLYVTALTPSKELTAIETELETEWRNINAQPTYVAIAEAWCGRTVSTGAASTWNTATASQATNPIATKLESLASDLEARAIVDPNQTTEALCASWGGNNQKFRLLGVMNPVDGADSSAAWIAARERAVGVSGFGIGMDFRPVAGSTTSFSLTPESTAVSNANNAKLASIVRDGGQLETIGGSFSPSSAEDSDEAIIDVAFRMDLIRRRGRMLARERLYGHTYSDALIAAKLTTDASVLVTPENAIQEITYSPRANGRVDTTLNLDLRVRMIAGLKNIIIHTNLTI